jgi:fucose permease
MEVGKIARTQVPAGSGTWMAGFFLLGILLGMLGSLVITWQYHIDLEPESIGVHFLAMSAGYVVAALLTPRLFSGLPVRTVGMCATGLAFVSLIALAAFAPPAAPAWRIGALAVAGLSAGALTYTLFYANRALFETAPASSANRAGALFVGGGLLATVVVGVTYFGASITIQTGLLSLIPAIYLVALAFNRLPAAIDRPQRQQDDLLRETLKDLRSIASVLFSMLVFFQFCCEWAIVGWLPLFLIHRLGMNPATAVWALAFYFFSLMIGRLLAQMLLPIVSHKKMLIVSVAGSMAGYLLLSLTEAPLVAITAAFVIGLGHAPIYPLIAERLNHRFSYHAGFYSGTVSVAMAGALATPWLLGYVAESLGMRAVMLVPSIASILVLILSFLIMVESRLMGGHEDDSPQALLASDK